MTDAEMEGPVYLTVRGIPIVGVPISADLAAMAREIPNVPDTVPDDLLDVSTEAEMLLED